MIAIFILAAATYSGATSTHINFLHVQSSKASHSGLSCFLFYKNSYVE